MKKLRIVLISGLFLLGMALAFFFNIESRPTKEGVASSCNNFLTATEEYLVYNLDGSSEEKFRELEEKVFLEAFVAASYVDDFSELTFDSSYSSLADLFYKAANATNGVQLEPILIDIIPACEKVYAKVNKS